MKEYKIYLRALEIEDSILINKWRHTIEVTKYLAGNFNFVSLSREKKSIESKIFDDSKNIYLGVCLKEDDSLIGYVQANNLDLRNLKVEWGGTFIGDTKYIGKGYGEEASKLLLKFLFDQYPINKCYAYCLAGHPATPKLFKKLGFSQEGFLRQEVYKNGFFNDLLVFSLLRSEIKDQF
jgi:RimJ/RimL family protein N-acetyltransferase